MMIDVVWLSYKEGIPGQGYWDQTMVQDLFNGEIWSWENQYGFNHYADFSKVVDGCVVVMPARNQAEFVDRLNADISRLKGVVLILTGDEESVFPVERVSHPNIRIWVQNARPGRHESYRKIACGYTPHTRTEVSYSDKSSDWFFSGQVNNRRREDCVRELELVQDRIPGHLTKTGGFTQGLEKGRYSNGLAYSKIAPAPGGIHTPDTFRLFEALELGCIPLADECCQESDYGGISYWAWFFGVATPFPLVRDWAAAYSYMSEILPGWKNRANKVYAWWQGYKRQLAYDLRNDIREVSGIDFEDTITVLIPTSPIPSHPSTAIIEQCVKDIRTKLPKAEIIILIDGINPKQLEEHPEYADTYPEYTRKLLWLCNFEWNNVLPVVFDSHHHQVRMTRRALELVRTPAILFVEHDAPICPDVEFGYSWDELVSAIVTGDANVIRFHHEKEILEGSRPLLLGDVEKVNGVPMVKTSEWSQRPHLAGTRFYKEMLDKYFSPDATGMIEDKIYGNVLTECRDNGIYGWYLWRLWIFHPEGDNIKRSYHLNGRDFESKYDDTFRY